MGGPLGAKCVQVAGRAGGWERAEIKMPANISILQENLQRLEDLNAVMQLMSELDRIPVSQACQEYCDAHPFTIISH